MSELDLDRSARRERGLDEDRLRDTDRARRDFLLLLSRDVLRLSRRLLVGDTERLRFPAFFDVDLPRFLLPRSSRVDVRLRLRDREREMLLRCFFFLLLLLLSLSFDLDLPPRFLLARAPFFLEDSGLFFFLLPFSPRFLDLDLKC